MESVQSICFLTTIYPLSIKPKTKHVFFFLVPLDDLRQLNDKLVEVSASKMSQQLRLDELEAAEVNIKVS